MTTIEPVSRHRFLKSGHRALIAGSLLLAALAARPTAAVTCTVPSTPHPTIQSAIDDATCTTVEVAAGSYGESPVVDRTLVLQGAGSGETYLAGQLEVTAGVLDLQALSIFSPPGGGGDALLSHSGAEVRAFDVEVVHGSDVPLFADGFETGDTSAWSSSS